MILDDANNDLFSANMRQGHCLTAPTEWSLLLHLHIPTAGLTYIMLLIFAKAPCYLEFFIAGFHAFFLFSWRNANLAGEFAGRSFFGFAICNVGGFALKRKHWIS